MRSTVHLVIVLAAFIAAPLDAGPERASAAANPVATPASTVRFYLHALGTSQCDLAFKLAGQSGRSLSAFRRDCRAIRHVRIGRLDDPGYRLRPHNAAYTCLAVRYTVDRHRSTATSGGWYLMERTLGPAWHILFTLSHIAAGGSAVHLTRTQCARHLPSYVHPGSGRFISGSASLSPTAAWIALSTSGSYLPNGSCSHGIGSNCESALTTVYRTEDAGRRWTPLLHVTTAVGPPVWIRLFSRQVGLVAATIGPLTATAGHHFASALFSTHDGGRHWQRFSLPASYATQIGSISFLDPRHGWLWYGGGAMGSMSVDVYRTTDGGRHWSRVACTAFSNPGPGYTCAHPSGISLGGDKEYLTFKDGHDGWLTVYENSGVPDIYRTADGGVSWRRQGVGLPPGGSRPAGKIGKGTVYPSATLLQPSFLGRRGLLPETAGFYRAKSRASWRGLYVYRSTDGGRTWPSALRTPVSGDVALWQALGPSHWVFLATSSNARQTIWSTENGGTSWEKQVLHLPTGLALVGLRLINARDGWATAQTRADSGVSASGTVLLHTTDGGAHWGETRLP